MDPFETMKALGDMWGKGSEAFLKAQRDAFGAMTKAAGDAMPGMPAMPSAGPDFAELEKARLAYEKSWAAATELSSKMMGAAKAAPEAEGLGTEILGKIFDPVGWFTAIGGVDDGLTKLADGPRLADLWNVERKFAAVFTAWLAVRRRSLEHHTLMLDVWTQAAGRFAQLLNERQEKGEKLESWRDVMPLWIDTANDLLVETQRSESFLASQRELLTAATDLKLAQQDVATFYSEAFGYPTRAELDDVHKALTELRRELRATKRARRATSRSGVPA